MNRIRVVVDWLVVEGGKGWREGKEKGGGRKGWLCKASHTVTKDARVPPPLPSLPAATAATLRAFVGLCTRKREMPEPRITSN